MGYISTNETTTTSHQQPPQGSTTTWSELVQARNNNVVGIIGSTVAYDGKMEDSTTATSPTLTTGGIGDGHTEEDDTTTIRSIDSIGGRGGGLLHPGDTLDDMMEPPSLLGRSTAIESCSVSTAPTDEASSLGGFIDWSNPNAVAVSQRPRQHRRVPSWEQSPHSHHSHATNTTSPATLHLPPTYSPPTWGPQVASFRDANYSQQQQHRLGPSETPPRAKADPNLPFLPRPNQLDNPRNGNYHHQARPAYPYHLQQQAQTPPRRPFASAATPPRPRTTPAPRPTPNGARSPSEVLKTLLRKKACLYESDTSRAVALVTWLVGRSLALDHGFFSRQQLQAGVHACVAPTMEAGWITRTKVNRCMQIILNSCFHYIIPRPDGTEESGERMRALFALEMRDDTDLLALLPPPWHQVRLVEGAHHPASAGVLETPQSSPKLTSVAASPGESSLPDDASDTKRAVLLCFNENVRSAEDVFRCHNEFIRDTAHACHLQLSANEWRLFFGREAAAAPRLWGNIGIPVPALPGQEVDALGVLTNDELGCLRTSWCSKRYDHDHELCGFAHPEVNGGWLRRDPRKYKYEGQMCPHVSTITIDYGEGPKKLVMNECPHGMECRMCHSAEELAYHPTRYKQRCCSSIHRHCSCTLGEVCPDFHPSESYRFSRKPDGRSPRRGANHPAAQQQQQHGTKTPAGHHPTPLSSPILYIGPAPMSRFEQHLHLPGLQSLFRQNSAAVHRLVQRRKAEHAPKQDGNRGRPSFPRSHHVHTNHPVIRPTAQS